MQVMFSRLIGHPRLILESLLMSEQISVLSSLFNEMEELREDSLILSYAKKAITRSDRFGSSSSKTTSSEFSSSGNKNTKSLWEDTRYTSAPNINLAKSLLDLCQRCAPLSSSSSSVVF